MRTRSIVACVIALLLAQSTLAIARDAFDGKWETVLTPEGGGKEVKDLITFKGSQFTSQEFAKKGFPASAYEEDTRGAGANSASWKASVKSSKPAEGTAEWSGTITAMDMNGELKVTKGDGTVVNYTLKATKKPEK
jgi:hypothetical protein